MTISAPPEQWETHYTLVMDCIPQSGCPTSVKKTLPVEHELEVYLDEVLAYRLICSPVQLPELVLGRLLSEGVITKYEDVELLYLCHEGKRAKVFLAEHARLKQAEDSTPVIPTCCTGNQTLVRFRTKDGSLPKLRKIPYKTEWIFAMARAINSNTPLYAVTHNVHSCILSCRGEILVCSEDIGRHNAMDKVLGWAMLHQIDLSQCILYTSGRVPVDMTSKAIRAGVPILASKALPTQQAVELAEATGLTLIGAARPDSLHVFA